MEYRHFKGNIYTVIYEDAILESNPDQLMVVYKDKDNKTWIRPKSEFFGFINETIRRFELIK